MHNQHNVELSFFPIPTEKKKIRHTLSFVQSQRCLIQNPSFTPSFMSFLSSRYREYFCFNATKWDIQLFEGGRWCQERSIVSSPTLLFISCVMSDTIFSPSEPWVTSVKIWTSQQGRWGRSGQWSIQKEIQESVAHRRQEKTVFLGGSGQPRWEPLYRWVREVSVVPDTGERIKAQTETAKILDCCIIMLIFFKGRLFFI